MSRTSRVCLRCTGVAVLCVEETQPPGPLEMIPPNIAHPKSHVEPKASNLNDLFKLYKALPKQKTTSLMTPFQKYFQRYAGVTHWHVILGTGLVGYTMNYFFTLGKSHDH